VRAQEVLVGVLDLREQAVVVAVDVEVHEVRAQAGEVRDGREGVERQAIAHAREIVRVLVQ